MIRCQRCNTENLDGSQYCDECGALLATVITPVVSTSSSAPQQPPVVANNRVPETREDYANERSFGMKTSVVRQLSSADDNVAALDNISSSSSSAPAPPPLSVGDSKAAPKKDVFAKLIIQRGRSVGKEFALVDDEIYIGRWDADGGIFPDIDLDADDPEAKVSRRHARITRRDGQFYIEDLGSTNGTFINRGRRLLPGDRQPIHDGDEIIIGKTFMRFLTAK